jgi:hypothetical protein
LYTVTKQDNFVSGRWETKELENCESNSDLFRFILDDLLPTALY